MRRSYLRVPTISWDRPRTVEASREPLALTVPYVGLDRVVARLALEDVDDLHYRGNEMLLASLSMLVREVS